MSEQAPLRQRLDSDLKDAMRAGDQTAKDTIRFLMAAVKNAEIDKGGALDDAESDAILQKQAKLRQDAIEQFGKAGRDDLIAREAAQLEIVRRYLPTGLSDDELAALVREVATEVGAVSPKDLGRVMPVLIKRAAGRVDGRRLNEAARSALQG